MKFVKVMKDLAYQEDTGNAGKLDVYLPEGEKSSKAVAYLSMMLHFQPRLNAYWPVVEYYGYEGRHYFADTDGMDLDEAQEAVEKAIRNRVKALTIDGKDVAGEFLYPGMMHTAARAGLSASPKVLKETCGPVMIAAAFASADRELPCHAG